MRLLASLCLLSISVIGICLGCGDSDFELESDFSGTSSSSNHHRVIRRSIVEDRKACKPGDEQPITRYVLFCTHICNRPYSSNAVTDTKKTTMTKPQKVPMVHC